ncbi:MAG TPA: M48 family metalloprotease [Rhodothermales bacterium]
MNRFAAASRTAARRASSVVLIALLIVPVGRAWCQYLGPSAPDAASVAQGSAPTLTMVESAYLRLALGFDAVRAGDTRRAMRELSAAESTLKQAVTDYPRSRDAAVGLGVIYFYQGYYGDAKNLRKCIDHLTLVLEVDPYADQAARYLASSYAQLGDGRSVIYYANYVDAVSSDVALKAEMATLRSEYQNVFLNSWNHYGDYYSSDEAVVTEFNKKTFRDETILAITPEYEQQLGASGLQRLTEGATFSTDLTIKNYVQNLVNKLAMRSPGPPFSYVVDVLVSDEVNAMALPGRIVVNTGLLRFVENEAELVAVLAHELAHVYAHHAARKAVVDMKNQKVIGGILSQVRLQNELHIKLLNIGIDAGLELIRRGYNRRQESEADQMGTHIAYNAGYNPTFMTSFFVKLYEANPKSPPRLLATHPPTDDRIADTSYYLELFPLDKEMQIDSREFQEIKRRLPGP